jgi:hypothetical protein
MKIGFILWLMHNYLTTEVLPMSTRAVTIAALRIHVVNETLYIIVILTAQNQICFVLGQEFM